MQKIVCGIVVSVYVLVLLIGVLGRIDIAKQNVKIDLDFSGEFASKPINFGFSHLATFDIVINLLMLIPIGTYFVFFNQNIKIWKVVLFSLLIGLGVGLCIETLQFILPVKRSVQLSDALFNSVSVLLGAMYGLLLILTIKRLKNR
ncbi:MAG: VanZ family protein [Clostridia bacterium]|nr:VanZ family protein [Clostridia bacterium]